MPIPTVWLAVRPLAGACVVEVWSVVLEEGLEDDVVVTFTRVVEEEVGKAEG